MTTVLQYLVIAGVIGLVAFALVTFVFGRGEQLAPLSPRVSPTELPDLGMSPDDVRKVRFAMALRGYRMSDVDWALDRMADELERLRGKVAALSGEPLPDGHAAGDRLDGDPQPAPTDDDVRHPPDTPGETQSVREAAATDRPGRYVPTTYEQDRTFEQARGE